MIPGHNVVDVVDSSGSESDFGEVNWPDPAVSILGLILGVVGGVDMVMDVSVTFIPFLIVILLEVLMGGVDGEVFGHPCRQLDLFVDFVKQEVVLLADHAVAVCAVASENLEAYDIINKKLWACLASAAQTSLTMAYLSSRFLNHRCLGI